MRVIMMKNDTIAAISTALGQSAINIVRMSGDDAIKIINKLFVGKDLSLVTSHTIHYGKFVEDKTVLDEVLVSVFRAPKTFTREDLVEINCHGGAYVAQRILEALLNKGARLADKGEFTERAYLNGRIDLTQAESIMDIIEARSHLSLALANKGLDGKIYELIVSLREELLDIIAQIEVNIDYPEYDDVEELTNQIIVPKTELLLEKVEIILEKAHDGQIIREGVKTAIIGRPNVGKSSLLNVLLGEERAIVTEIQGTTRDTIEGTINLGGIILHLIDTAGIRESEDIVERIGIKKAKEVINQAQLVLFMLNNNEPLNEDDLKLLDITENKKRIVIINKIDLESKIGRVFENSVSISALNKVNIDILESTIKSMFLSGKIDLDDQTYLSNTRHIAKMQIVKQSLLDSIETAYDQMPVDMVEIDLKNAWDALGEIIGETKSTALLDELFSKFCLGK
ncbi:MAG: tRNA uridine-5-carboxymethylaminomethyl(34) synthesis GTPase MnmE [Candidatus Izemoplasmataceae bacterium]